MIGTIATITALTLLVLLPLLVPAVITMFHTITARA